MRRWRESAPDRRRMQEIYREADTDLDRDKNGNGPGQSPVQTDQRIYADKKDCVVDDESAVNGV